MGAIVDRALADEERGLGALELKLTDEARAHLVNLANGDARAALNALEAAAQRAQSGRRRRRSTLAMVEDAAQQRALQV